MTDSTQQFRSKVLWQGGQGDIHNAKIQEFPEKVTTIKKDNIIVNRNLQLQKLNLNGVHESKTLDNRGSATIDAGTAVDPNTLVGDVDSDNENDKPKMAPKLMKPPSFNPNEWTAIQTPDFTKKILSTSKVVRNGDFIIKTKKKKQMRKIGSADPETGNFFPKKYKTEVVVKKMSSNVLGVKNNSPSTFKFPRNNLDVDKSSNLDGSYATNEASFLIPEVNKSKDGDEQAQFLANAYPIRAFTDNLFDLIPSLIPPPNKSKTLSKKVQFVQPKTNPFSFKNLYSQTQRILHGQKIPFKESERKLPPLGLPDTNRTTSVLKTPTTRVTDAKPTRKISFENLYTKMIEYKKKRLREIKERDFRNTANFGPKPITPVSRDPTIRLQETPKAFPNREDLHEDDSDVSDSSPGDPPSLSPVHHFKITMNNDESFVTNNERRRKTLPPQLAIVNNGFKTDKQIPAYIETRRKPESPKKRESRVRFVDEFNNDLECDDDILENTSNISNLKNKSKSMGGDIQTADALNRFKINKLHLNAPKNIDLERRSSVASIHSMDSNLFKRGLESMLTHRRRSTLFEKSSRASVVEESEHGLTQINQFKLLKQIGKGGYSIIRLAYHLEKKKYFAMKIINIKKMKRTLMSKTTSGVNALENEIDIMKKIKHKHCVQLEEVIADEEDDQAYLAIDYVKKGSLDIIKKHAKITEEQIRKYFRELIIGLEYLHSIGIIHRDIKPENLLIDEDDTLKITDFGISEMIKNGNDTFTNTAGTNYYFPPEACTGKAYSGKKADIWACGVTLYNLLLDKYPFNGKTHFELNQDICENEPLYNIHLDFNLAELLKGLLEKDPEKRYGFEEIKQNAWVTDQGREPLSNVE